MPKPLDQAQAAAMAPLALAYLGDAVYELYVRTRLLAEPARPQKELHQQAVCRVKAGAQAAALRRLASGLTAEEADIARRGRNARVQVPKGADPADQHYSTAFEALIGYLYLSGSWERLETLMAAAFSGAADDVPAGTP